MEDALWLLGVSCRCRVGVPEKERAKPQRVLVDVGLRLDLQRPGGTDDVGDAVDYAELERRVRAAAQGREFRLVERLASELAATVLRFAPGALEATVRVHKKPAAMPRTREVVVEITRPKKA